MEFVVYCDESRHDQSTPNKYMSIGGLWVPRTLKAEVSREFRAVREGAGLRGEVKWSKVSQSRLADYQKLVDFFFERQDLRFRAIVVDQSKVDVKRFHAGDRELGFYKFYFEMLEKWILPQNRYLVLLDFSKNKGADRYRTLRRVLENKTKGTAWIDDLTVIDSYETPLAQLSDLLTGAVAATWCGFERPSPKALLAAYIGDRRGASLSTSDATPAMTKLNVFCIDL